MTYLLRKYIQVNIYLFAIRVNHYIGTNCTPIAADAAGPAFQRLYENSHIALAGEQAFRY